MTPTEWAQEMHKRADALKKMAANMPRYIGIKAVNYYKENYHAGGYRDNGFHAWQMTKRQLAGGKAAASKYGPLFSSRNRLFSSINYRPQITSVIIYTDVPYAAIHNEGGTVTVPLTGKMRKWAWAMYYKNGGSKKGKVPSPVADPYKWLALSHKSAISIKIPKRPFIYDSPEVRNMVKELMIEQGKKALGIN